MRIYGLDFTSTPKPRKPITVARCEMDEAGGALRVRDLGRIPTFAGFERGLAEPGPWVAGMDFPFGQPRRLVENQGWPGDWQGVVRQVEAMSRQELVDLLDLYRASRPPGDKEHLRRTDRRAGALSPMKVYGTPLAKMFHEGAPRLAASSCHLPQVRPADDDRVVLEAYPGLVARTLAGGRRGYKSDVRRKQTGARRKARKEIVAAVQGKACEAAYGFPVEMSRYCAAALVDDPQGDHLDAVLCAVQAAWAWRQGDGWGLPDDHDPLEGSIADPALLAEPGT